SDGWSWSLETVHCREIPVEQRFANARGNRRAQEPASLDAPAGNARFMHFTGREVDQGELMSSLAFSMCFPVCVLHNNAVLPARGRRVPVPFKFLPIELPS